MKRFLSMVLLTGLLVSWGTLETAAQSVSAEVAGRIIEGLKRARPDLEYDSVTRTPVDGIYQVAVTGGPVIYTTADADYMFAGDLYQVLPGQFVNVAEQGRAEKRREVLAGLDRNEMIVFPPSGETRAVVNVFTDVDCGFCRRFHQEVPALNRQGVEVRYLAYPRAGVGSGTYRKMVSAWCADEPREALARLKRGEAVAENLCDDNPVAEQFRLGREFGVTGTPSLVLMDGTLLAGYRPAPELLKILGLD